MAKNRFLGEFELLVMTAMIRLGKDAYGATIRAEIESRAKRSVTVGALYATLARLEDKKYVFSRVGEATPQRGGRAKRYFKITALGRTQLDKSVTAINRMLDGVSL
ncbi:MAG: helix-turn-helix transcriptional regulator [Pseudomonadota bacterium]